MELPPGLPSAAEFEKLDRISREQWRLVMARVFISDMGADVLREICARGKLEWRMQFKQIQGKHSLREDDVDWIFEAFKAEIRRRDRLVGHVQQVSRN